MKPLMSKPWKSLLAALVSFVLLLALWPAVALAAPGDTGTTDIWNWTVLSDNTLSITGCTNPNGDLTLPTMLDCGGLGTLTVSMIGNSAFLDCTGITSFALPFTLTAIDDYAFRGCTGLSGISLSGLAFLQIIGQQAFFGCTGISSIDLPYNITTIAGLAFCGCTNLETVIMQNDLNTLGNAVFSGCTKLNSVTLSNSLTSIGYSMFYNCTALKSITIPASVTSIGETAFRGSGLTGITIPDTVQSIHVSAFQDCTDLASATLPDNGFITAIPSCLFYNCASLTSVTIPAGITSIGNYAFSETGLASLEIPSAISTIEEGAFSYCPSLASITVDASNTHFTSVGGVLYTADQSMLVCYPSGKSGAFSIPSGVTEIGPGAFEGCTGLTGVTIPDSVSDIDDNAFLECGLTSVTLPAGVNQVGEAAFGDCINLTRAVIFNNTLSIGDDAFSYTGLESDGIYGHAGSAAATYAVGNSIPFKLLLALSPSPASLEIFTGGRITITPNVAGGAWSFPGALLSRSGNRFTGRAVGMAHVTYTAGWQSESVDVLIRQGELPPTGQDFTLVLWLLSVAGLAGGASLLLFLTRRRRQRAHR
jgi:hypothetical protein